MKNARDRRLLCGILMMATAAVLAVAAYNGATRWSYVVVFSILGAGWLLKAAFAK
jgi:hypothetical protein